MRDTGAKDDEPMPLDPVALTLAVWLGLMVCVAGLVRLSANMPVPDMGHDTSLVPPIALGFGV